MTYQPTREELEDRAAAEAEEDARAAAHEQHIETGQGDNDCPGCEQDWNRQHERSTR